MEATNFRACPFPSFTHTHVCVRLYYASHHECCLFTQLTHCCLMFSRSTISLLNPVFYVHSAMWLWPTCLQHTVKVSKYDRSCQSQKQVKKKKSSQCDKVKKWWHYLSSPPLILHFRAHVWQTLWSPEQKKHICVFSDLSYDRYLRVFGRCHIWFSQIPRWTAALNLWTCSTLFYSRTFIRFNHVCHCCVLESWTIQ